METKQPFWSEIWRRLKALSVALVGAAALLVLARQWTEIGFTLWAEKTLDVIEGYFDLAQALLLAPWVPTMVRLLDRVVPWELTLPDDWRNLFVLLTLYLSSHVREAFGSNVPRPRSAFVWRILAALLALVLATTVAVVLAGAGNDRLTVAVLGSISGIVVYRIGFAAQFAYDRAHNPTQPLSFRDEFTRKALGVVPLLVGAIIVLVLAHSLARDAASRWDFFWVLLSLGLLGSFHLWLARKDPSSTGNRNIGTRIVLAVACTIVILLLASPLRDVIPL